MVAEIIKGIPVPAMKRRGAAAKYPWATMQPGDAFKFDPDVTFAGARSMASAHQAGTLAHAKFVVRETDGGVMCWRVDGTPFELKSGNVAQFAPKIPDDQPGPAKRAELVSDRPHDPIVAEEIEI